MRVTLIHNPEAGEGHPTADELRAAFETAGHELHYASSKQPGWDEALDRRADLVVSAGGDGTVAKLVPRLAGSGVPLALLPLGTANNIGLSLELSFDWQAAIAGLDGGTRQRFDCGRVSGPWGSTCFVESVGAGLVTRLIEAADAEPVDGDGDQASVAERLDDIRRLGALLLDHAEAAEYVIDADGADLSGRYLLVEVMNIRSIGPRLRLAPEADPGDGLLDLVLVDEAARERFADDLQSWLDNWTHATPWPVRRVRRVSIDGEDLAWHVDDAAPPVPDPGSGRSSGGSRVSIELVGHVDLLIPSLAGAAA